MARNEEIQQKLRDGIDAARRGERDTARRLLEQVTTLDSRNEVAWLWLASLVNTVTERRACLERVLEINPNNGRAREALQKLTSSAPSSTSGGVAPTRSESQSISDAELRARRAVEQRRRQTQQQPTPRRTSGGAGLGDSSRSIGGISTSLLIGIGSILAVALLVLAVLSAANQANTVEAEAVAATETANAVVALSVTETPTETFTPAPTNTGVPLDQITPAFTLPPTFTPTFTPSPTITPTPTPEPIRLERFDLVYSSLNSGADQPDVYLSNGEGTFESLLADAVRDMAFSPDGLQLTFIRDVEGIPQVFVVDFGDLQNARQLTTLTAPDTAHPSFSPDGRLIVFSSSHESPSEELWIIGADGSGLRKLTDNTVIDRAPAWSPTANEIVFISDSATPLQTQIFLLVLPESGDGDITQTQLTFSGNNYAPSWSHDGAQIAYVSDRFSEPDIYLMDREGLGSFLITTDDGNVENRSPSISPDGRWVAYVSNRDGATFQTYVISVDGTVLTRVSNSPRSDQSVVFRPVSDLLNLRD